MGKTENRMTLIFVILINIAFSNTSLATEIESWVYSYNVNQNIWIELKGKPNNNTDWIGVYPKGSSNSWGNVVSWVWANDTSETQNDAGDWYKFEDKTSDHFDGTGAYSNYSVKFPAGKYEARFFLNNSYVIEDKVAFEVNAGFDISSWKADYNDDEDIWLELKGLRAGNNDWIGIYPKGSSTSWGNVVSWVWANDTSETQNDVGDWYKFEDETSNHFGEAGAYSNYSVKPPSGEYEARFFLNNSSIVEDQISFRINKTTQIFGARPVESTPLEQGTLFASPNGNGTVCTNDLPCSIEKAVENLMAGDVLFLKGGNYHLSTYIDITATGTEANPIIIESYPGELAVLDGLIEEPADILVTPNITPRPGLWVHNGNNYISIRKLEVKNMRGAGIKLDSHHNTVQGCIVHGNHYNGIHITDGEKQYNAPYVNGFHTISDNIVYDNSDVGINRGIIPGGSYNNGNNSDGISVSSSKNNTIVHNTVYANSDDGIDTWRSNYAYVAYNSSFDNGKGDGNGNGFKTGSSTDTFTGLEAKVEYNISYNNKSRGFDFNSGLRAIYRYNTAYNNGFVGFKTGNDTLVEYNISSSENGDSQTDTNARHTSNSWQENEQVFFISTDPGSVDFLKPTNGSVFERMGVYAE